MAEHQRVHDITLITTIAIGFTAALVFGLLARRFGMSPIVGYLLAGIVVGPYTPGFVADVQLAAQLAEVGVILLMFGVGLNFHVDDLRAVRAIAIPGALVQSTVATLSVMGLAALAGWGLMAGAVLGVAIAVASTVVLLRVLTDAGLLETTEGRVAVGWLIVQDIMTVLVLVLLPALAPGASAGEGGALAAAGLAVLKLVALGAIMLFAAARFVPALLLRVARLRSRELFTLTVLVVAMAVATLGYVTFGASLALGAFLAGMVVGQSKVSHQAAADALPLRDAFAVLFFVSIGMLFDWRTVLNAPGLLLGLLGVVLIVNPLAALSIVIVTGHSLRTGLTVAAGLAQIGEFSFILAEVAGSLRLMPAAGHDALVACAIVSISLNPWLFRRILRLEPWVRQFPRFIALAERRVAALGREANAEQAVRMANQGAARVVVVGYGPVGRTMARRAEEFGLETIVIDINIDTVLTLQAEGKRALYGDASRAGILKQAGVDRAAYLAITLPDTAASVAVLTAARELNPNIIALARVRYLAQGGALEQAGADAVCYDEAEAATALAMVLRAHFKAEARREADSAEAPK